MGSLKRKSDENPSGEPAQKQHKENGSEMVDSEPVTCIHDVSYPGGCASPTHSGPSSASDHSGPAKVFPFSLDPFQAESIKCLENGESVRVSAHTSAGKTVVALYAIAMSLRNKQRVIYTFLIKALNNEKYREFKQEFSDVGFMTGDVMLEPNASCLVHIH